MRIRNLFLSIHLDASFPISSLRVIDVCKSIVPFLTCAHFKNNDTCLTTTAHTFLSWLS